MAFDLLPELDAEHEARLRDDWVKIASIIHDHIPVDVARELSVPVFDPTEIFERASRVEEDASLSDSVRDFAAETVESASRIDLDGEEQYFLHSDFHLKNVLADPHTRRMTGLIDWSDCRIGPLAREFSIWEWGHDDSLPTSYEALTGTTVDVHQAKQWLHLEELADLVEQRDTGDHSGATASLSHIVRWIAESR